MSEFNLSGRPAHEPLQTKSSQAILRLLIFSGAFLLLAPLLCFLVWNHYLQRYGRVDHSADTVEITVPQAQSLPGTPAQLARATVYRNPQSGVTLKVPGVWGDLKDPGDPKQDPSRSFCIFVSRDLSVRFWPIFPDFSPSLDVSAGVLAAQFGRRSGFRLTTQRELIIRGNRAKEMEFRKPGSNFRMNLVLIRRWPAAYALLITGYPGTEEAWKQFEDALPEAVEIE